MRKRWLVAGSLALAGCAVGPDDHGPPPEEYALPGKFKNAGPETGSWKVAEPADHQTRGEWWAIFRDAKLNELVQRALERNQDLRQASARIAEARAMDGIAAAQFYPTIDFAGSAQRERATNTGPIQRGRILGPPSAASPVGGGAAAAGGMGAGGAAAPAASSSGSQQSFRTQPLSINNHLFRAPLDLSWELDLFGRVRRTYESSRAQRESIEADFHNMALSVAANVTINYFTLRSLDAEADILDRTIKTRREGLRISEERLQAGLTSELDVARAQSDLAQNEADVFALARTRGQVENALATLSGEPATLLRLTRRPLASGSLPPRVPAGLPAQLLERRPDVAAAERQLASANASIGVARAAFFPVIKLTGIGGFQSADIDKLFNWQSRIWQIGPSISLPIFEGGRNVANLGLARARYDEAVAKYRGQVLAAFEETENALNDLRQLAGQQAAVERALTAARRSLVLAQRQYDQGSITFLDVLDAERAVLAAERTVAQLAGQRFQAAVQLIKALGGGWG